MIDEDTAYAWALHYEMSFRWLVRQKQVFGNSLSWKAKQQLDDIIGDSEALKKRWIKAIAEENWRSMDFSLSDP